MHNHATDSASEPWDTIIIGGGVAGLSAALMLGRARRRVLVIEALRQLIYDKLDLMSVYLKEPGKEADMNVPLIMFRTGTIRDLCEKLHKDFVTKFKFSRVWGKSAKFGGQKLMLGHHLKDGDVVEIHVK